MFQEDDERWDMHCEDKLSWLISASAERLLEFGRTHFLFNTRLKCLAEIWEADRQFIVELAQDETKMAVA